ncbi:MAG: hypothetical protein BIP78_0302 [Candidatus Bipolaricaulis sibiricus]|uniref:RCK C-terminal domain-containing protein n=1 Tax=Bipolaricaulis sibiricus TaxID=2501609 RepID=A0A410FT32_BIPS1|nr:MAG: hypothetical protein BIP78_0302 [Candidatus Bipolaricaulis sibiricus]
MTGNQILILGILAATLGGFLWGRWRHDMIALGSLLACVLVGLVPAGDAFAGFGHPAVITVACVLVLSSGLQASGAVDVLTRRILKLKVGPTLMIGALTGLAALLSSVMNNVGALALLMPIGLHVAARQGVAPGRVLMPLAFGSILGGMTTLIGTPPNLIVSAFRAQSGSGGFGMFDFAPVGLGVAGAGVLFIALVGWRLVPARRGASSEGFDLAAYLTEARVDEGSKVVGMTLREVEEVLEEADAQIVSLVRSGVRVTAPNRRWVVRAGDILLVEAQAEALANVLGSLGLKLEEAKRDGAAKGGTAPDNANRAHDGGEDRGAPADEAVLVEYAVLPDSDLEGRSARDLLLRTRYGVNLLAVSRQGRRSVSRLRTMALKAGDVLLLQGPADAVADFASEFSLVPLAERSLRIPDKRKALTATLIMGLAVLVAAAGLLPAAVAFAGGVLASLALRTVSPRTVYDAIDWPVIVLLGSLIPVAGAMETTGAAALIARSLLTIAGPGSPGVALGLVLVVTMLLSAALNNAATAAVMCPIALGAAAQLGVRVDPFLMAIAVGASCSFITPIAHQNNTLILGPGGFRFGDYLPLGLPLQILAVAVGVPLLLRIWPL